MVPHVMPCCTPIRLVPSRTLLCLANQSPTGLRDCAVATLITESLDLSLPNLFSTSEHYLSDTLKPYEGKNK